MAQVITLKRTNANYFSLPLYYETSKSSYSEWYSDKYYASVFYRYFSKKMQQLDICKQKANERLFKKTGKRLSANQASCIDALILCDYTKTPLISFYEDKIKVQIDSGKNQYMLDFNLSDSNKTVLVGLYKDSEYAVKQIPIAELQNFIRG